MFTQLHIRNHDVLITIIVIVNFTRPVMYVRTVQLAKLYVIIFLYHILANCSIRICMHAVSV